MTATRFKSIFLSDIHLGTKDSKIDEVIDFLQRTRCDKLVLNGDIIDGWHLKRGNAWPRNHTRFVRLILDKMEKENTEVIYLRGNHDDILERFLPLQFGNLTIDSEHIHESPHGRYLVVHGDGFDAVTTNQRWIAVMGASGYSMLLRVNRLYNHYRKFRGKPQFSLSKAIKAKVKSALTFVCRYEEQLQKFARKNHCQGIICGHIHTPANRKIGDVHYLNSGDWVETLSAVVENLDRSFEVLTYEQFCGRIGASAEPERRTCPNSAASSDPVYA